MRIAPAGRDDLANLVAFRDEAARWLAARGIDQWSEPWPSDDLMVKGMLRNIAAGETFIVWDDDGTPAATITLNRWAKPELWTPAERAEPALYAHKATVARAFAGEGLGGELLDWAGTRAANEGARWLRVDVWTTNDKLQQYYRDQGFTHVRTVVLPHNPSGAVFQRPARRVRTPRLVEEYGCDAPSCEASGRVEELRGGDPDLRSKPLDCNAHRSHRSIDQPGPAGVRATKQDTGLSLSRMAHEDLASGTAMLVRNFSTTSSGACGRRASAPSSPPRTGAHGSPATHRPPQHDPALRSPRLLFSAEHGEEKKGGGLTARFTRRS